MAYLAYVRHGLSQANIDKIVAGHFDTPLVDIGRKQAKETASLLKDITFHHAHGSPLQRAKETLEIILEELHQNISPTYHDELKERNWGAVEGKSAAREDRERLFTREEIDSWFTWDGRGPARLPSVESYKDMSERIVPFFDTQILPKLKAGQNVLVVSHNGISKPLQRHIEDIAHEKTHSLNLRNCEVKLYEFDETGKLLKVESRLTDDVKTTEVFAG